MGSSLSSNVKALAQKAAPAQRKLKPFSPAEIGRANEALNRIAEQEQARMKELPSMEELNAKDGTLDDFLMKLGGSISGRDLSPDEPSQASTSGRSPMPPARPPQALRAAEAASWRSVASADDQPGRLQSYVLREVIEARTAAAMEQKELDLSPFVNMYGADRAKLLTLMEHACMPSFSKVATFGHQYAFARPPAWWLRKHQQHQLQQQQQNGDGVSGSRPQLRSEPPSGSGDPDGNGAAAAVAGVGQLDGQGAVGGLSVKQYGAGAGTEATEELRRRLMGNPVAPGGEAAAGMFGAGKGADTNLGGKGGEAGRRE